jgi:chromosome segregation ATPase
MTRFNMFMRGASISALLAFSAVPAYAGWGKADRAHAEISSAQAKIESANKLGASTAAPAVMAHAQAELQTAKENLESGNKDTAIEQAIDAQRIADTAIGQVNRAHQEAAADHAAQVQQDAQTQVDAANARADSAAASAQDANDRAQSAQQAAAAANAQAEAARNQPTTTVTTVEKSSTRAPVHKVVHRVVKPAPSYAGTTTAERTTTTVSTTNGSGQ